ncbi:hypothetical protein F5Y16DRAFT_235353 [Xylariaceae sp. FL0255]|nr:hypothetical protein F5Y16DRAFT_235353 [Xylariaceae sp. FL0255]
MFLRDGGRHVHISTHADVLRIVSSIHQGRDWTSLHADISQDAASAKTAEISLNLCCRLILMMNIGEPPQGIEGPRTIRWDQGTLREFTEGHFGAGSGNRLQPDRAQIGKIFTALNPKKIGGMCILWTPDLAEHLRLMDDDKTICLFSCPAFLRFQMKVQNQIFPPGFIDETLRSLALLLPQNDKRTQDWIASEIESTSTSSSSSSSTPLDPLLAECGSLGTHERRFEHFSFWHDRLVVLRQALDEAQPQTLTQWWYDRRNGVQWYTFWVAILVFIATIFFGVMQSLEGALQVYVSYQASKPTQNGAS